MTRKSFEWQQKEQQEKKDKEANRQLQEIVKYFLIELFNFFQKNSNVIVDLEQIRKKRRWTTDEEKKYRQLRRPENGEIVNNLIQTFKEEKNGKEKIDDKEEETLKTIIDKIVIKSNRYYIMNLALRIAEKLNNSEVEERKFNDFWNKYQLKPEFAKTMGVDYKVLEQIYYKCMYNKNLSKL